MAENRHLAAIPLGMLQPNRHPASQHFAGRRTLARKRRLVIVVLHEWTTSWGWLLWVLMISAGTSYAGEDSGWGANEHGVGMEERASARPGQLITIPHVTGGPRGKPSGPNYAVIARALGLSDGIVSLLDDLNAVNDPRLREKPQKILANYLLSRAVERVPFFPELRTHIPKGVRLNVNIDRHGVSLEVKVPLPALIW